MFKSFDYKAKLWDRKGRATLGLTVDCRDILETFVKLQLITIITRPVSQSLLRFDIYLLETFRVMELLEYYD